MILIVNRASNMNTSEAIATVNGWWNGTQPDPGTTKEVCIVLASEVERHHECIDKLRSLVTTDHETKEAFIARVRELINSSFLDDK